MGLAAFSVPFCKLSIVFFLGLVIADRDGAQDREFAANPSPGPPSREDNECFAIYLSLWPTSSNTEMKSSEFIQKWLKLRT
jgi:hypothetical protein